MTDPAIDPVPPSATPRPARRPGAEAARLAVAFALGAVAAVTVMRLSGRPALPPAAQKPPVVAAVVPQVTADLVLPEESREWPALPVASKSKATLWTKPGDGGVLYRLVISELPEGGVDFDEHTKLVVNLLDADGFALAEQALDARANTKQRAAEGKVTGYEWVGRISLPRERFDRVSQWSLSSSGIVEFVAPALPVAEPPIPEPGAAAVPSTDPSPAAAKATPAEPKKALPEPKKTAAAPEPARPAGPPPRWTVRANWSKVTPGMSPQQVTLTLGVPRRKEERDGMETWYYGDMETGGYVFFIRDRLKSVSPPR